ncbi:putative beclin 1-associated autophagy-related key regulator-like protein, partial [Operophtera brumata]
MASSYFTESEAPRDFRVSSTESDSHYTKCLLCYTVKRNFYCSECIRTGNFVQSSMPYSDRLKANRKYILDRCEKLLLPKLKKDTLITEAKQSRDRLDLLRLAIEQRRCNIEEKQKELAVLKTHNNDLKQKLPRYQKRVLTLGKHVQNQSIELHNKVSSYDEQTETLAALRRSRIRHLTKYIFPEPPKRPQLHIVTPWINTDADFSHIQAWSKEAALSASPACAVWRRNGAGLALAAQLLTLLAWVLDT